MPNSKVEEIVFLNGKFIAKDKAMVSVWEPGFLYGWGLFETMRAYQEKIIYFDAHLARIKNSCVPLLMQFPYPLNKLKGIIRKLIKINGFTDTYLRLTLWKTESVTATLIICRKYKPYSPLKYRKGFMAGLSSFRQNENYPFAQLKTTNYLFYQLAYQEAKRSGFDEAIILNNRGFIAEGSRSNLFFIKDNQLFTPSLECGCLSGITRKVIFDLAKQRRIKIEEGRFTLENLYNAEGAFLTNSLMGVMPLASLAGKPIAKGKVDGLTRFLTKKYNQLLKNGI